VAEVGGQLRRLRRSPGLLGWLRLQLPSVAADGGRPTGRQEGEHSKPTERSRDVRAGIGPFAPVAGLAESSPPAGRPELALVVQGDPAQLRPQCLIITGDHRLTSRRAAISSVWPATIRFNRAFSTSSSFSRFTSSAFIPGALDRCSGAVCPSRDDLGRLGRGMAVRTAITMPKAGRHARAELRVDVRPVGDHA
jgi:hypothetical protein